MYIDKLRTDKIKLLLLLMAVMGTVVFMWGVVRLFTDNYVQGVIDLLLSCALGIGYLKLHRDPESFNVVTRIVLFFALVSALNIIIHFDNSPMRFIWFSTAVYLVIYLLDKREGLVWTFAIVFLLVSLFFYDKNILKLDGNELFTWLFNIFIILLIVNWYEKIKQEYTRFLLEGHAQLMKQVKAKTSELQELNNSLTQMVEVEVEKNRQREQLMLEQTRLAQMGEMISMIAHQWRQPLNAISLTNAALELKVEQDQYDKTFFKDRFERISGYVQHLSSTVEDFREFFKPEKEKKETTFIEIIENSLSLVRASVESKNISVRTECFSTEKILSYPNELVQVLLNLIKNAEDALLEQKVANPLITIRCYSDEQNNILEVEDNAVGIDEEIISKVFNPYFTTKKEHNGTGLGLYMSKIIIEEHCNGRLSVSNNGGAVFKIALKRSQCDIS